MLYKEINYNQLCKYYADRCKRCYGKKRITIDGVNKVCSCQLKATIKHRIDSIEIYPDSLRYKKWSDFTGIIGDDKITGQLNLESVSKALYSALSYCFNVNDIKLIHKRKKHLTIQRHLSDGQNIIISGDKNSGKTMLAALILKEVAYACVVHGINMDFKWIKFADFFDAARWTNNKSINNDYLDYLSSIDFLSIDGIDKPDSGHNNPADMYSLNSFFGYRNVFNKPIIFICSRRFLSLSKSKKNIDQKMIIDLLGEEFYLSFSKPNNYIIDLEKETN